MGKIKYRVTEKGRMRLTAIAAIILLFLIVIIVNQNVAGKNGSLVPTGEYDSKVLGEAILKVADKFPDSKAIGATVQVPADPSLVGNFFNQSLFIGDSRMQGLMIYSGTKATGYTEKGMDVKSAISKPFVFYKGKKYTIPEALKLGGGYDKIIIKLGINELGWTRTDIFKKKYSEFVGLVKAAQPKASIYIHAILPVTAKKSADGSAYNNQRIAEFNNLIKSVANEQGIYYIDIGPKLADANGFLPENATSDGIHLNSDFCKRWLVYIKEAIEQIK